MLGNSSNKHSEVLPTRGSLTLVFMRLVFKIKTNRPPPPNSRHMLVTPGHPCHKFLITHGLLRKTWEITGPFQKEENHQEFKLPCVLFLQSDVPAGKNVSLCVISTSQSECGTCFQMPPGSSTFPFVKDMVWHSESGRQFEVPL